MHNGVVNMELHVAVVRREETAVTVTKRLALPLFLRLLGHGDRLVVTVDDNGFTAGATTHFINFKIIRMGNFNSGVSV